MGGSKFCGDGKRGRGNIFCYSKESGYSDLGVGLEKGWKYEKVVLLHCESMNFKGDEKWKH